MKHLIIIPLLYVSMSTSVERMLTNTVLFDFPQDLYSCYSENCEINLARGFQDYQPGDLKK